MFTDLSAKIAFRHAVVEAFFAILPLVVLGTLWSHRYINHELFWSSPEVSITSCVLYGLTLIRTTQGAVAAGARIMTGARAEVQSASTAAALVSLAPVTGMIFSALFIYMSLQQAIPRRTTANLALSVICYVILGGYGLRTIERIGERQ